MDLPPDYVEMAVAVVVLAVCGAVVGRAAGCLGIDANKRLRFVTTVPRLIAVSGVGAALVWAIGVWVGADAAFWVLLGLACLTLGITYGADIFGRKRDVAPGDAGSEPKGW